MMKKKLFALIGGTLMSAMFLAGCGDDDDNNPAPENDNMIEENQDGVNENDANNLDKDNDGMIENDGTMTDDDNNADDLIEDAEKKGEDHK